MPDWLQKTLAEDPEWQRQMAESEELFRRAAEGEIEAIKTLGPPMTAAEMRQRLAALHNVVNEGQEDAGAE